MSTSKSFSVNQKGLAPIILILLAALGLILYLLISNTFSFKDKLFSLLYPKPTPHAQEQAPSVPDEILLKFKAGVDEKTKDKVLIRYGLSTKDIQETIPGIDVALLKIPEKAKDKLIEALNRNPNIEYAEPNYIVQAQLIPNDPGFSEQWALTKIQSAPGWDISTGSSQAVIAILDTGIATAHEDLKDKLALLNGQKPQEDDNGHGTLVSGVAAAATNNAKGVAGVCWNCPILSFKVINCKGFGSDYSVSSGIVAAADNGAKVINMSLGAYTNTSTMQTAVNYAWNKGVVVVAASGNDGITNPFYPAAFDNVVAVGGSSDSNDTRLSISNYGSWLDVIAPGVDIVSTTADIIQDPSDPKDCTKYTFGAGGGYGTASGTSMASPHVAGLAGLIFSANPALSNQQVIDIITSTADDLGDAGFDIYYGWGRINVAKALQKATNTTPQPTPTPTPTPTPQPSPSPDTTLPQTSITSPTDGSTVSGNINIQASASDNVSVSAVSFFVDGIFLGEDTSSPYEMVWNTTSETNGSHIIQSKAVDPSGNVGQSTIVNVTVNNIISTPTPNPILPDTQPPTVSITNPVDGLTVTRNSTVNIQANASDNVSVSKVEFLINNSVKCTDAASPYTCSWKVPGKRGVSYTLTAKAYDTSNNQSSAIIKVTAN